MQHAHVIFKLSWFRNENEITTSHSLVLTHTSHLSLTSQIHHLPLSHVMFVRPFISRARECVYLLSFVFEAERVSVFECVCVREREGEREREREKVSETVSHFAFNFIQCLSSSHGFGFQRSNLRLIKGSFKWDIIFFFESSRELFGWKRCCHF